jgi:hypothetical protein
VAGAQAYIWLINGTLDTTDGQTLPTSRIPADADVFCAALGPFGTLLSSQALVYEGQIIEASTTTTDTQANTAETSARAARSTHAGDRHKRGARVTLALRSSGRASVALWAYNVSITGSGKSAKTRRRLAYRRIVTIKRGISHVHFGAKLHAGSYEIVIRGVKRRGRKRRLTYSARAITVG